MAERVTLEIDITGGQTTVQTVNRIIGSLDGLQAQVTNVTNQTRGFNSELNDLATVATAIGGSVAEAEEFISQLGLSATETARAIEILRASQAAGEDANIQATRLQAGGLNPSQITQLTRGIGSLNQRTTNWVQNIGLVSFAFNNVLTSIQVLAAQGAKAYDALIGQNERLQQEVLSTQASLAATTDVFQNGQAIADPKAAILALEQPIKAAIETIREDSLELVGVTSSQLIPLFQILATNTEAIADQSKSIPDPIEAASRLTVDFAATLGTLNVPLFQARQEINSILQGTIDQNSAIAKNLGLTNEQVRTWKEQGVLVDELSKRLQPFVAGNALAAQSVSGITSNLQEVFEIITRKAGEPLYEDLVNQLQDLYDFVQKNKDAIAEDVEGAVEFIRQLILTVVNGIRDLLEQIEPTISVTIELLREVGETTGPIVITFVEELFNVLTNMIGALNPLLSLVNQVITVLNDTGLTEITVQMGLLYGALSALGPLLQANLIAPLLTLGTTLTSTTIPAIASFIASSGGLVGALGAFAAAALPVIAILGALGAAFIAFRAIAIGSVNDAIDGYASAVKIAGDETLSYATQLKLLNDALENNGALTDEQTKKRELLIELGRQSTEQNNRTIAELKALKPETDAQARSIQELIKQLEISNEAFGIHSGTLERNADGTAVQARALQELGGAYEQLQNQVETGIARLNKGTGNLIDVQRQAKQTLASIKQLLDAGEISTEQAISNLAQIANNSKLTSEEQLAAQKAIFDAVKQELNQINSEIKQLETERLIDLQEALNNRLITEAEYNARSQKLSTENIKQRLAAEKELLEQLEEANQLNPLSEKQRQESMQRISDFQLQLLKAEKAERDALVDAIADGLNREVAAIKRANRTVISGLQDQQSELKDFNAELDKTIQAGKTIERNLNAQSRIIEAQAKVQSAAQNLAVTKADIEINELKRVQEIREKLASGDVKTRKEERELIQEMNRLGGSRAASDEGIARKLKNLQQERAEILRKAQVEEEKRARRLLDLEIQRNEVAARRAEIEAQSQANQAQSALIQAQQQVITAGSGVTEAQAELVTAQESGSSERIAAAEERLRLAQEEGQRAKQAVDISAQQLQFAEDNVVAAKEQSKLQEEISIAQKEALNLTQQAAEAQRDAEDRARSQADQLERSADAAVRLSSALNSIGSSNLQKFGTIELPQNTNGEVNSNIPISSPQIPSSKAQELISSGQNITRNNITNTTIATSNQEVVNAVNSLKDEIKNANLGSTSVDGINIYNQYSRTDDKKVAVQAAIEIAQELTRALDVD